MILQIDILNKQCAPLVTKTFSTQFSKVVNSERFYPSTTHTITIYFVTCELILLGHCDQAFAQENQ